MKNKNMVVWEQVCISDPKTLKKLNYGFKPTVIDAQSQVKRATEVFGPMGIGWGIDKEVRHFEDGMMFYSAVLWYMHGEQRGEVAICSDNSIKNDVMKSCQTDALTKGLSRLGFNSDVFENKWDGDKYIGNEPQKVVFKEVVKSKVRMSDLAQEQSEKFDGSEGVDLQKEMTGPVFQPEDKVQFGYPSMKQKTYKQCTKKELKDSHEFFSKGDNISEAVQKHLNTIEAELYDRSNNA